MVSLFRMFSSKAKTSKKTPTGPAKSQQALQARQPTISTIPPPSRQALPVSPSASTFTRSSSSTTTSSRSAAGSDASTPATSVTSPAVQRRPAFKDIKIHLTPEDAAAVKKSWKETIGLSPANAVAASSGSPASLFCNQFYQNLFAVRPDLEFMFPDIGRQSAALSGVFQAALAMLESIEALDEILLRMGRRHAFVMGIEPEHFELLGVVFIQTMRDRLGENFTPQIETTWVKIYSYLASKMIAAGVDETEASTLVPSPAEIVPTPALATAKRTLNQQRTLRTEPLVRKNSTGGSGSSYAIMYCI
ncbi:globin-like protein [Lipomyces chichibuensis]|uniref:globin-like protein n=1 Tax=Lipomyces chichibuensis TaxID=1546026 RepID=UPI003343964B